MDITDFSDYELHQELARRKRIKEQEENSKLEARRRQLLAKGESTYGADLCSSHDCRLRCTRCD